MTVTISTSSVPKTVPGSGVTVAKYRVNLFDVAANITKQSIESLAIQSAYVFSNVPAGSYRLFALTYGANDVLLDEKSTGVFTVSEPTSVIQVFASLPAPQIS